MKILGCSGLLLETDKASSFEVLPLKVFEDNKSDAINGLLNTFSWKTFFMSARFEGHQRTGRSDVFLKLPAQG